MELRIVRFFNQLGKDRIDGVTDFLSRVKYLFVFWAVISALAIFFGGENRENIFIALAMVTAGHFLFSEGIIKHTLTKLWGIRQRPYVADGGIVPIGRQFSDSSFPSSHMASTLAMLWVLVYFFSWAWPLALIFAIFMAFARLHNGMHYLSDILAGIILGIAYGALGIWFSQIFLK
jgi:undecaprenyl-diphosphatase